MALSPLPNPNEVPESELKLVNDKYFKSTVEARKGARDKEAEMRGARHGGADLSKEVVEC